MPTQAETHERMLGYYAAGDLPWDDELPPPEVIETLRTLPAGRALDLGCGFGRASRYFAAHKWDVDGVDFVAQAVETARERSADSTGSRQADFPHIRFHQGSVTQLDFLQAGYDLALDVGCGHALSDVDLGLYCDELVRLLKVGGMFLCFGRIQADSDEAGFNEDALFSLFKPHFKLTKVEYGETIIPNSSWRSAWYWWQKS